MCVSDPMGSLGMAKQSREDVAIMSHVSSVLSSQRTKDKSKSFFGDKMERKCKNKKQKQKFRKTNEINSLRMLV